MGKTLSKLKVLIKEESGGFVLFDVLFAILIAGIMAAAIPGALSTANRATIVSNELTAAESIARSQIDSVQNQTYDVTHNPPVYSVISDLPPGYSLTQTTLRLDPKEDGTANDDGLQEITVTVTHGTKFTYTLVDYKINYSP